MTVSGEASGLEIKSGMRSILQLAWAYEAFQRLVGKNKLRRRFVDDYVQPRAHHRILDIGCGPGDLVPFLNDVEYFGYDVSTKYIMAAEAKFGNRGTFISGGIDELKFLEGSVDAVVCIGVLHHVPDDVAEDLLRCAKAVLKPNGRFLALEPYLYPDQPFIARELIKRDRGRFVRSEQAYADLCRQVFDQVDVDRNESMLRVPYTLSLYSCSGSSVPTVPRAEYKPTRGVEL